MEGRPSIRKNPHDLGNRNTGRSYRPVRLLDQDFGMTAEEIRDRFAGRLVVSCQADRQDAFYGQMDKFARAAAAGGAAGIRANGPDDVRSIRAAVQLPIIG